MDDIKPFESLEKALKENKISSQTYDRVKVAKDFIEKKYRMKKNDLADEKRDWELINEKIKDLNFNQEETFRIKQDILKKQAEDLRLRRQKLSIFNYIPIAIIGKGAFGEVRVCKSKETDEIVAVKKLKKTEMKKKKEVFHVRAERDILSEAKNDWIVDLKCAFQDKFYLYLVMEFLPGGDLMNLFMIKDIICEEEAAFYAAEILLAIESVHELNCIHRDIKPDNILIDAHGHLKLSDFGLCKKIVSYFYPGYGDV